jgi:hypothetical protein
MTLLTWKDLKTQILTVSKTCNLKTQAESLSKERTLGIPNPDLVFAAKSAVQPRPTQPSTLKMEATMRR